MVRVLALGRRSVVILALVTACKPPTYLGAARVVVQVDQNSGIACVEVIALSTDTNTELTSKTEANDAFEMEEAKTAHAVLADWQASKREPATA